MLKFKKADFRPARERIEALPAERRTRIKEGAAATLKAMHLSEIRKALAVTQVAVSEKTGLKQAEVSRIESNPASVQIRTMERYVRGLGGEMKIVAEFPDGTHAEIPLRQGKPVRSKVTTTRRSIRDEKEKAENYAEPRLSA